MTNLVCAETQQYSPTEMTGLEWLQAGAGEKMDCVLTSMYILVKHDVPLKRSPNDYYNLVEEKLRANPNLYSSDVTDILALAVYEKEPGTKEALDKLRK